MALLKKKLHEKENVYFKEIESKKKESVLTKAKKKSHEKESAYFKEIELKDENRVAKKKRSHEKENAYFNEMELKEREDIPGNRIKKPKSISEKQLLKIFKVKRRAK